MELNHDRLLEKEEEIFRLAKKAIISSDIPEISESQVADLASDLIDCSYTISAPEIKQVFMHLVTMSPGGMGGGQSTKAGNIRFQLGKLFDALSKSTFTTVTIHTIPWLIPFGAIRLWSDLSSTVKISITEIDASVLYAMWINKNAERTVDEGKVLGFVNKERGKFSKSLLISADIFRSLNTLESIRVIARSENASSRWWLREWVSVNYR